MNAITTLKQADYPRSSKYDISWISQNQMGPHPLWLCEWLAERMFLKPQMRILDLGCGKALSSIFLAREYQVSVAAVDLWTNPSDNWIRIQAMREEQRVIPLKGDAKNLPFATGYFDAIISIDSWFYFGTEPGILDSLCTLLKPGGRIGAVMPGLMRDLEHGPPEHLLRTQKSGAKFWSTGCDAYQTLSSWRNLWSGSAQVQLEFAENMDQGWRLWRDWNCTSPQSVAIPIPLMQKH